MEGIYVGKVKRSVINKDDVNLLFVDHRQDIHHLSEVIDYEDTAYCLVPTNDIIINNDELLKLREQVKKLEAELTEIKTARTLREAYITGVEKGCESLREERDTWKRRWNSVVTDIAKSLEANGIEFTLKEVHGNGNWDVVIDIPELNEAKKKVEDLEKKLAASKSNETFWRNRKEEEEDYHHYWLHTFDRAVKQAADKGIHIGVRGNDEECNAGIVVVDNMKAEELEKRVVALEKSNNNLDQKIGAADNALEYWNNTYNDIVIAGKNVGVKIDIKGKKPDSNAGFVYVTNEKASDLEKQMVETFADLEKRLAATKSKETYWVHTFNRAVTQAEQKGVYIGVSGNDEENNAGVVIVDNGKANELESQIVQMEDANQKLRQRISAADEEIEELKSQYTSRPATGWRNTYYSAVEMAKAEGVTIELQDWDLKANVAHLKVMNHRANNLERQIKRLEDDDAAKGDHWKRNYEELTEYWDNTYKDIVAAGKKVGVKIDLKGRKPDGNVGTVYITNEKALELAYKLNTVRQTDDKWQAMLDALKDKGVEVIYMGEEDDKPIIDVKIPKLDALKRKADARAHHIDILKKELETLKSRTLDNVEVRLSCGDIVWTYCDGFVHVSSLFDATIPADEIATGHINCLCKNNTAVDAESISHGTIPKCKSCANYVRGSRSVDVFCHKPVSKEGPGTVRRLSTEEAEAPACVDFKARKE